MILASESIKDKYLTGKIVIFPYNEKNLKSSSYDVTLGEYYYEEQKDSDLKIYNLYDKDHVAKVWGKPKQAKRIGDYSNFSDVLIHLTNNIKPTDKIILLPPNTTILAHTNEFIGGVKNITTMMKARSSLGRNFIAVCKCAGYGDIGYFNRWTMEITNNSNYYRIPLIVGRRIAQIVFMKTTKNYDDYIELEGKYQVSKDLHKLADNWSPEDMLPKMYNDWECKE